MVYPPLADHTVLLLPFTEDTYTNVHPLLPLIFQTLTHSSYSALTAIFSTPSSAEATDSTPSQPIDQLYTQLRKDPVAHWTKFQTFLGKIYATLAAAQWRSGRVLMDVEVRFVGEDGDWSEKLDLGRWEDTRVIGIEGLASILPKPSTYLPNPYNISIHPPRQTTTLQAFKATYPVVALGGTFDHLHAAHKLLLHLSLFLATRKIIVGVMTDSLLLSKSNAPLVQNLATRIDSVKSFLIRCGCVNPDDATRDVGVECDVVEIKDPLGPTGWDVDIQALVVSQETTSGGEYVNRVRKEKGLPRLEMFIIDVISHTLEEMEREDDDMTRPETRNTSTVRTLDLTGETDEGRLKDLKMGSTAIRQWIADRREGIE